MIKTRYDGSQYNHNAGFDRNIRMAEYADALIAIPKNSFKRSGTWHMIKVATEFNLQVFVFDHVQRTLVSESTIRARLKRIE